MWPKRAVCGSSPVRAMGSTNLAVPSGDMGNLLRNLVLTDPAGVGRGGWEKSSHFRVVGGL